MRRSLPHKIERLTASGAWIGFSLNPIEDVEDVASAAEDAWNTAVDAVPGARSVADAVDAVVTGPVRDFAHTAIGQTMFTALASSLTGGLAPLLGPQMATVAFALPGLAKGESFAQAWTQEFASRVKQTAAIMGDQAAADAANAAFSKVSDWVQQAGLSIDWSKVDFHALAKQLGVREDYVDLSIAGATGDLTDYLSRMWDPKTGKEIPKGPSFADQMAAFARKQLEIAAKRAQEEQNKRAFMFSADPSLFRVMPTVHPELAAAATNLDTVASPVSSEAPAPPPSFLGSLSTGEKILFGGGLATAVYGLYVALRYVR